jgi:hypothetical protein
MSSFELSADQKFKGYLVKTCLFLLFLLVPNIVVLKPPFFKERKSM